MTIKEIVEKYLKDNGFDGLYCGDECACGTNDLMPCGEPIADCKAGYYCKCDPETCTADGDCDFHIGPVKGFDDNYITNLRKGVE